MLRPNQHNKAFAVMGLFNVLMLIQRGGAFEYKVGGSNGWAVPADPNSNSHNQWAENNRFQIGDTLLFVYSADKDSVLHVTREDYTNCNTSTPLEKFADGHTVFKFDQSGPYCFISGVHENCLKNEKLVVIVMADRSNRSSVASPSPSPSTSTEVAPSPAPAGEASSPPPSGSTEVAPSPEPAGEGYTPPPSGSVEINPSPAPSGETHKNGASSIDERIIGFVGTFVGSYLVLFI
ncbi:unnamed protein product [Ilex paraguariensis]|uniref:Phytocyanin domain-containing protein n=1 Tax=Ilex paraguariensis TaxID=185542 RepID=A0ABC8U991_9AQUA